MGKDKGSRVFFEVYMQQKKDALPASGGEQMPFPTKDETKDVTLDVVKTDDVRKPPGSSRTQEIRAEAASHRRPETPDLKPTTAFQEKEGGKASPQGLGLEHHFDASVRYDTIIYAALGAVFLSVGCFFLGHKLGYDKGINAAPGYTEYSKQFSLEDTRGKDLNLTTKSAEESQEIVPIAATNKDEAAHYQSLLTKQDDWTLQIITYKEGEKNTKKATDLADAIKREIGHDAFVAKTVKGLVVCVGRFDSADSNELLALKKKIQSFEYENKKQFKGCYPVQLR